MTPEEIKQIKDRIKFLETKDIEKPIECSRINEEKALDKKKDFEEIVSLYKRLADEGHDAHYQITNFIKTNLLVEEALNLDLKYVNKNKEIARKEKCELLIDMAEAINLGDCLDEIIDHEENSDIKKYDANAGKNYLFDLRFQLLNEAKKIHPCKNVVALIEELFREDQPHNNYDESSYSDEDSEEYVPH